MKKRFFSFLLAVCMSASLLMISAEAAETVSFSDVPDQNTALAIETLRLMGVLDGYGDGTFRPGNQLTRAQFCKMAAYAMGAQDQLGLYRTITVFPDVKPSHWAAGYINLAAKGEKIIAGFADGKFHPDRTVTAGQAVTILLRLLGYKDENIGGVWPDSYMAAAAVAGLTDGMNLNGSAPLTRGQAARLFVNLLQADAQSDGVQYTLSEETELLSLDGGAGTMRTAAGTHPMVNPTPSTSLVGARGRVVLMNGKAMTFLPLTSGNAGTAADAIIVYADRSATGFSNMAGNTQYTIYKNGVPIGIGGLRKNDVATYSAATNSIRVCDTRVTAYYEACEPSPSAPIKITVLGGTEFSVLPSARDTLAAFKPGDTMTLLLTADGQVAGAIAPSGSSTRGNAVGVVSSKNTVQLLCGTITIPLACTADAAMQGKVVRISSTKSGLSLSPLTTGASSTLDLDARKLGGRALAENVTVFKDEAMTTLSQLTDGLTPGIRILYARTNWADQIDLIVLGDTHSDLLFGRIYWDITRMPVYDDNGDPTGEMEYDEKAGVEYSGGKTDAYKMPYNVQGGDYVAAKVNSRKTGFEKMEKLSRLSNVSGRAWIGKTAVTFGNRTYAVPADVQCYNADNNTWITLDQALDYADTMNLFTYEGVIRIVEVGG